MIYINNFSYHRSGEKYLMKSYLRKSSIKENLQIKLKKN